MNTRNDRWAEDSTSYGEICWLCVSCGGETNRNIVNGAFQICCFCGKRQRIVCGTWLSAGGDWSERRRNHTDTHRSEPPEQEALARLMAKVAVDSGLR